MALKYLYLTYDILDAALQLTPNKTSRVQIVVTFAAIFQDIRVRQQVAALLHFKN